MTFDSWASIPWEKTSSDEASGTLQVLHKHRVPYTTDPNSLQNLDVWIPLTAGAAAPEPSAIPARDGIWVIYIHGGAWRDPLVDSSSFAPTISHLKPPIEDSVAGFASLNYSLSPHPSHPTHPAPPKDPNQPLDSSRQAKHPEHILDVLTGLAYLQAKFGFGSNYVLLGHSCGATLAFQVAMDHAKWGASVPSVKKPKAIVGLNGIYDMPNLIKNPKEKHKELSPLYEAFTRLAFGDNEKEWHDFSPIAVGDWASEWSERAKAFLVQSHEDTLVPYNQLEGMQKQLQKSKGAGLEDIELEAGGDHNDLWKKGDRLAEIVAEAVKSL